MPNVLKKAFNNEMANSRTKPTFEQAQILARSRGGLLMSKRVVSAKDRLSWKCRQGHVWKAIYDSVNRGSWCGECAGVKKLSLGVAKAAARKHGGRCLSKKYVNGKTKMSWECRDGHKWSQNLNSIRGGSWCGQCHAPGLGQGIGEMQALAKGRGGKCLSKTYKTARTKLLWQCRLEHSPWHNTPDEIKRGRWCPQCADGLGERICRAYLEEMFSVKFPCVRPDFLKNVKTGANLELDGYSSKLKIAFEHHGRQHFKTNSRFSVGPSGLRKRRSTDSLKRKLCVQNGIRLIEIPSVPDMLPLNGISEHILGELRRLKIRPMKLVELSKLNLSKSFSPDWNEKLKQLQRHAMTRGGICLSNMYLGFHGKLLWQCKHQHEPWEASPAKIYADRWCPQCGGRKRKTLEEVQKVLSSFGAKLISKDYENSRKKLRAECYQGHRWSTTWGSLRVGSGCPRCFDEWRRSNFKGPEPKRSKLFRGI